VRHALAIAVLLAASTATAGTYITIGSDALPTAVATAQHDGASLRIVTADDDVAVLEVDDAELAALSEQMHGGFHRCGGFIVHASLADALAAPLPAAAPLDYTLDRGAAVTTVLPQLDERRLASTIRELSAMPNRFYKSAAGAQASEWLAERWRGFATRPGVTVQLVDHGYPQKAVVLTIPGTTRPDEVIVLGGHLDSIAMGGISSNAPGADDDASGIATLTEIARVLLAADYRPARTIKIIAYEAEEVGLVGSQAIVRDFQRARTNVIGALQLDMTNYQGSDKDIWLMKDFTSAAQNTFLERLIDTYVGATWGLDACGYACSDHASWTRAGVPASMPFESRMRQRNKHIHTGKDTLAQSNGEAVHALKFARLGAAYAIELGKGELGKGELGKGELASTDALASRTDAPAPSPLPWQLVLLAALAAGAMITARRVT
jgi:leucyl aminopeptidase